MENFALLCAFLFETGLFALFVGVYAIATKSFYGIAYACLQIFFLLLAVSPWFLGNRFPFLTREGVLFTIKLLSDIYFLCGLALASYFIIRAKYKLIAIPCVLSLASYAILLTIIHNAEIPEIPVEKETASSASYTQQLWGDEPAEFAAADFGQFVESDGGYASLAEVKVTLRRADQRGGHPAHVRRMPHPGDLVVAAGLSVGPLQQTC
jgi:hypothetical protein